jgi:uncharacterized protein (TIGR04255 family)
MDYRNPTLTEILVELHLVEGALPEKNFMMLVSELASYGLNNLEFAQALTVIHQDNEQEPEPKIVPRIRCWDQERVRLVQISPDVVVVNVIGEYPGWGKFNEHVRTACEAIAKALKSDFQPARVELTTIDKWKADLAGFTIGQYLNCGGPVIPEWYSEVGVSSDISLGQGFYNKDGFNKRVKITARPTDDNVEFQLVITFGKTNQQKDLNTLMESLHSDSVQCFEGIITNKIREEVMGGSQ